MESKKLKFKIGDYVIVNSALYRSISPSGTVKWISIVCYNPKIGQIVGATRRYDGRIEDETFESPYFIPSKSHFVWKVRYGILNKAVEAFEKDLEIVIDVTNTLPNIDRYIINNPKRRFVKGPLSERNHPMI